LGDKQHLRGDLHPASLQDWLAVHLAVRLARFDRLMWVKQMRQAVVSRIAREQSAIRFATPYGFELLLPSADQGTLIMALGEARLHPRVREILEATIRPGDIVVDGGSNVGFFSLLAARLLDGKGQVISFEPDPSTFGLLRQNVEYNGLQSIVRLEQKALTSSDSTFEFAVVPHEPMRSSMFVNPGTTGKMIRVSGVRLDDYIEAHSLPSVDVIKLDLEGAEPFALAAMAKSLLTARLLVFEVNGPLLNQLGVEPLDLVRRVAELGSFKQISFVDEQENRTYAWNPEHFQMVLREREIVDILCTKNEIRRPSATDASSYPGAVVRSA
jgi:FkbM family methyltransferase